MDHPRPTRTSRLAGALHAWLGPRGLSPLAHGMGVALIATAALAASATLRTLCFDECARWAYIAPAIVETLGFAALLVALAMVGHWVGELSHGTWRDRLALQLAETELDVDADPAIRQRLELVLQEGGQVATTDAKGRANLWASLPAGLVAAFLLSLAAANFGDPSRVAGYFLPFAMLATVACLAGTIRGSFLLAGARRLTRPLRPQKEARRRAPRAA